MKYTLLFLPILIIRLYACPPEFEGNYRHYTLKGLKTYVKQCTQCHEEIRVFGKRHTYNEWEKIFTKNINEVITVHKKTKKYTYFDSKKFRKKSILLKQVLQDYSKRAQEIIMLPSFLKPSCLKGNYGACLDLGESYRTGRNNATGLRCKMDNDESKKYFKIGINILENKCLHESISACNKLSTIYKQGVAVIQDSIKSEEYNKRSHDLSIKKCNNGDFYACNRLGMINKLGLDGSKNIKEAKRLYQKGCDLGHKASCDEVEKL